MRTPLLFWGGSLWRTGGRGVGRRGGECLVPVSGIRVTEASSNGDDLVSKTLDVANRPGAQLGNGALVSVVHQLHMVGSGTSSSDSRGHNTLLDLGQGRIAQLVGRVVVVNISISSGNVPGSNDVSQVLQCRLDLDVASVSVTEGTVTERGAHVTGHDSEKIEKGLFDTLHLDGDLLDREGCQLRVGPGVGGDLMTRFVGALDDGADGGVVDTAVVVTVNKEGDLDLLLVEKIEELMGVLYCFIFLYEEKDMKISRVKQGE